MVASETDSIWIKNLLIIRGTLTLPFTQQVENVCQNDKYFHKRNRSTTP